MFLNVQHYFPPFIQAFFFSNLIQLPMDPFQVGWQAWVRGGGRDHLDSQPPTGCELDLELSNTPLVDAQQNKALYDALPHHRVARDHEVAVLF